MLGDIGLLLGQARSKLGRDRPKSGQVRLRVGPNWPISANTGHDSCPDLPLLVNIGRKWAFDKFRPNLAKVETCPILVEVAPMLAQNSGRHQPGLGAEANPKLAELPEG